MSSPSVAASSPTRPSNLGRMGVWIFILSLNVLFAAGIALFVIARTGAGSHVVRDTLGDRIPSLPVWLWFSTFLLFTSSVALHQSLQWRKLGLPGHARRGFRIATAIAWAFAALQVPGLWRLAGRYAPDPAAPSVVYFLVLFLVGLHLLHAGGGLALMTSFARRAGFGLDDAAEGERLANFAIFWHYLALVWLVLFSTFSLVR